MKMTSNKADGAQGPSIMSYFSTVKRKHPKLSIRTPAAPVEGHQLVGEEKENEFGTPASVASKSNDTRISETSATANVCVKLHSVNGMTDRGALDESSKSSCNKTSALLLNDRDGPTTPPSPMTGSHTPKNGMTSRIKYINRTETPPSNEADTATPQSPPTPNDTLMCGGIHQLLPEHMNRKRIHPCTVESILRDSSKVHNDDAKVVAQLRKDSLNMGTPASFGTPSTASSDSRQSNNFFRKYEPSAMTSIQFSKKPPETTKPAKKQKQSTQLFLDFGQNNFGKQTICDICGMLRVHGLDEDDLQHAKICDDYKQGVVCAGWKNERMVGSFGKDDRILEVRSDDSQQHASKVLEVKEIVDKELGFANRLNGESSSGQLENTTSYMYISSKRVVGLLLVKRIQRGYEFLPPSVQRYRNVNDASSSISRSLKPSKALLGIHQIWVHKSHRHRGIASHLVTTARDHLIFGMAVPLELIAFSSPTEEGLRFAQSYVGSERPLIYDIRC